jgi:hypothetical protein
VIAKSSTMYVQYQGVKIHFKLETLKENSLSSDLT